MSYQCISKAAAQDLMAAGHFTLVDIRDANAFAEGNIPQSIHVTDASLESFVETAEKDLPLIVYCYHGNSSKGAANYFVSQGFQSVYSLDGGYEYWRR